LSFTVDAIGNAGCKKYHRSSLRLSRNENEWDH
jgi:hypothetical protein